jgi:hypothetical protein
MKTAMVLNLRQLDLILYDIVTWICGWIRVCALQQAQSDKRFIDKNISDERFSGQFALSLPKRKDEFIT